MTARYARDNFTDLLGLVYYGKKAIKVEKKGRVFAVVVNPDEYQFLKKAMQNKFFDVVDQIQKKNIGKRADGTIKEIASTVDEVRLKRYGKTK